MCEARQGEYVRQGRAEAQGKAGRMRVARNCGCAGIFRDDALRKAGQMR
jgi:hypothetical protein